jgi:hypothetical protein
VPLSDTIFRAHSGELGLERITAVRSQIITTGAGRAPERVLAARGAGRDGGRLLLVPPLTFHLQAIAQP